MLRRAQHAKLAGEKPALSFAFHSALQRAARLAQRSA
jgi:hypothetical protein